LSKQLLYLGKLNLQTYLLT